MKVKRLENVCVLSDVCGQQFQFCFCPVSVLFLSVSCEPGFRKEFANLKSQLKDRNKLIDDLEIKEAETNSIHKALQSGVGRNCRGDQEATSLGLKASCKDSAWNSIGSRRRRYSGVVAETR